MLIFCKKIFKRYYLLIILLFLVMMAFLFCSGCNKSTEGVAAYVNDASISEETVSDYVAMEQKRLKIDPSTDAWNNYLSQSKMTSKSYRDKILDTLIDQEIIRQYCAQNSIYVTGEEVNADISIEASTFSSFDEYISYLDSIGQTLEEHKEIVYNDLLKNKSTKLLIDSAETPKESIAKLLFSYSSELNGAKGYYQIIFPIDKSSQMYEIYNKINSGQISFENACSQISAMDNTGLNFDYVIYQPFIKNPEICNNVINSLNVGQISDPISDNNYIYLYKVVDEIKCSDNIISLTQLPEYTKNNLEYYAKILDKTNVYDSAYSDLKSTFKIHKYDPPANLPY